MRIVRGLLIAVLALAALLTLGIGAVLSPPGQRLVRDRLVAWASTQLGRELDVDGELRIEPGLHHLRLSVTGVRLANAPWGSESTMLAVEKLAVDADAWSFLDDTVILNEVAVDGLTVLLERTAEGAQNWDFELPPAEDSQGWTSSLPVIIKRITMPGARLRFIGPRLERPLDIRLTALEQSHGPDDMLDMTVRGQANDTALALTARAGPFAGLVAAKDFRIELKGALGELALDADVGVDDLARPVDTTATLRVRGPHAAYLAAQLGVRNLGDGPLDLTATLSPAADRKGIVGSVTGTIGGFSIEASGALEEPARMAKVTLDAGISGPDLSLLGGLAGVDGLPPESFRLSAKLSRAEQALQIDAADLELSDTELHVQGRIGRLDELGGATLQLQARGADIARIRRLLRIPGVANGAFEVTGTVKPGESGVELVDVRASTSAGSASVTGKLGASPDFFGTRLTFSARGPDFAPLGRAAGMADPPGGAFEAAGEFQWTSGGAILQGSTLRIGDDRLTVDGAIGRRMRTDPSNLRVSLAGKNLAALLQRFGLAGLPASPYQASGAWRRQRGRDRLDDVVVTSADARLRLAGQVNLQPPGSAAGKTDLTVSIEGSELSAFTALAKGYSLPTGPFSAAGEVALAKDELSLTGIRFAAARATGEGSARIGLPVGSAPVRIGIQARGEDLRALVPGLAVKRTGPQPFDLGGDIAWRPGRWSFERVRLGIAQAQVTVDGDLDQGPDFSATALRAGLHLPDMRSTGELLGLELPPVPLEIAATLSGTLEALRAANVTGRLGGSDIRGDFSLALKDRPELSASLRSDLLDLRPFFAEPTPVAATARTRRKPSTMLIPDRELPLGSLGRANARVSLQARKVQLRGGLYDALRLEANLTDGRLVVDPIALSEPGGGRLSVRIEIASKSMPPTVRVTATGRAVPFSFLPGAVDPGLMSRYEADIDLAGQGGNLRDIVGSATGRIRLSGTGGQLSGTALNSLSGDFLIQLLGAINPFAKQQPYTDLVCQALLFRAEGGMLRTDPAVVLRTSQVDVISQGAIDLATEKIDFNFRTAARKGIGISAAELVNPYIKVSGTLAAPKLTMDTRGTIVSGGAAVATGGLSILAVTAWDRIFREKDPCAAALREADKRQ